jgi:3-oxo-5-alpha-steroid 4-dehydrogenase 1
MGLYFSNARYPEHSLSEARVVLGIGMWLFGFVNVIYSDSILRRLRKPHELGYKIPRGGAFEYTSSGHYTSELIEWLGLLIASGAAPAACFFFFTFGLRSHSRIRVWVALKFEANLFPRALETHKWYLSKFKEYPKHRKAILPFVW